MKVPILRYDGKIFLCCKFPNGSVATLTQAALMNVCGVKKEICQPGNEPGDRFSSNRSFTSDKACSALTISGKRKTGLDIFLSQVRKIMQDLLVGHP